jgi:HEPN domain-containing protein
MSIFRYLFSRKYREAYSKDLAKKLIENAEKRRRICDKNN